MPRLLRVRFVSVGHPQARMEDLVLDFRDREGKAADSTIWLRNGGGKSSILNLFFAIIRPHKSEFLGGRAESRQRSLEDYVQKDDRSAVVAEWELDAPSTTLELGVDRFLTGAFYEHREGSGELRRIFFATRVSDNVKESTIEGLPLFVPDSEGKQRRRTLSAFREVWLTLRAKAPALGVAVTENQHEWQEILESAGIDPDLYSYQVKMNLREGGADALFQFKEPEEFIDFLLELALDPSLGDRVSRNIVTYRRELVLRKAQYLPERDLVTGLLTRLDPLEQINRERLDLLNMLGIANSTIIALETWVTTKMQRLTAQVDSSEEEKKKYLAAIDQNKKDSTALQVRALTLLEYASRIRLEVLQKELDLSHLRWREAQKRFRMWNAAGPLRNALRFEARARELRRQLEERQNQYAPLRTQLGEAANQLFAALAWQALELRKKASENRRIEDDARQEAREARDNIVKEGKLEAAAVERIHSIERRLDEAKQARQHLLNERILLPEETAIQAFDRSNKELADVNHNIQLMTEEITESERKAENLNKALTLALQARSDSENTLKNLKHRLEEAQTERDNFENDMVLRIALELEELDLDRLDEDVLATLDTHARQEQENAVKTKVAEANDQQAALHIEEHGLLPPSSDVQRLLNVLQARLGAAWAGWSWIEANVPKSEAYDLVRRAPQLAQGIIVRPQDLHSAIELLSKMGIEPEAPVVLAGTNALDNPGNVGGEVLGPGERSWFDKAEAQRRLSEIKRRLDKYRDQITHAEQNHRDFTDRLARLRHFRQRYPRGWFKETAECVSQAIIAESECKSHCEEIIKAHDEKREERKRLENQLASTREQRGIILRMQDKIRDYLERHEQPTSAWHEQLAKAEQERDKAKQETKKWMVNAEKAEQRAADSKDVSHRYGEDARAIEEEGHKVSYISEPPPLPRQGILDILRDRYSQIRAQYEKKIGAENLLALAEMSEGEAQRERAAFTRALTDGITEKEVRDILESLTNPDNLEIERQKADEEAASSQGRVGNLSGRVDQARQAFEEASAKCDELGSRAEMEQLPETPEVAEEEASNGLSRMEELEAKNLLDKESALQAETLANNARQQIKELSEQQDRLLSTKETFADLLAATQIELKEYQEPREIINDQLPLLVQIRGLEEQLRSDRVKWQDLDKNRHGAAQEVRAWIGELNFERINTPWVRHLRERDDAELEKDAVQLREQLGLRLENLNAQITEADRHRAILLDEVLGAAEEGLKLLSQATNMSRLPDHLPNLGGAQFLRITAQIPDDAEEKRGRIGQLVDELADNDRIFNGVALVQAAVRRLARSLQVKVLHPDPALERRTINILEMSRASSGEQLTGAILLYCTLARLRARSHGLSKRPSSVLLLDNPIGRASRVRFLDLQREVAQGMGVQLIYTTAVNDHEALSSLPNIIRLRNERVDRNRGHRLVEGSSENESLVESVHIGRDEDDGVGGSTSRKIGENRS